MKKFCKVAAVMMISLAVALGASAQEKKKKDGPEKPRPSPEERFKKLDTNGDGKVTLEEFTAIAKDNEMKEKMTGYFKKLDKGNKGFLTLDDFKNAPAPGKKPPAKKEKK